MSRQVATQVRQDPNATPSANGLLQRTCACGKNRITGEAFIEGRKEIKFRPLIGADQIEANGVPPIVQEILYSPGQPLDVETRAIMEPRFGYDFSRVRIHTNGPAAESARALNAVAYTVGRNVIFDAGRYAPYANSGKVLLAHELAHVVQQDRGGVRSPSLSLDSPAEQAASRAENAFARGNGAITVNGSYSIGISRQPRSLDHTLDSKSMSDADLLNEVMQLRQWLSASPAVSDPDTYQMMSTLSLLEDEAHRRHKVIQLPKSPLMPLIKSANDKQRLLDVAKIIQGIFQVGSDAFTIVIDGKTINLTQDQVNTIRHTIRSSVKDALAQARSKAAGAEAGYLSQSEVDKKHWVVSRIVKFIGNINDPGPSLLTFAAKANANATVADAALNEFNFTLAAAQLADAEAAAISAHVMYQAYWQDIINTGEMTVTVLEYTRDASFTTLAVLATIASAGTAAGVASVGGVGLGSASAAGLIATGAPIVSMLGETGVKLGYGDKVDWGRLAADIVIAVLLQKFGGKISHGIVGKIAAKSPALIENIGLHAATGIVTGLITGAEAKTFATTAGALFESLRGKPMTWDQFINQLILTLTDPKGLLLDAFQGGLTGAGAARRVALNKEVTLPTAPVKGSALPGQPFTPKTSLLFEAQVKPSNEPSVGKPIESPKADMPDAAPRSTADESIPLDRSHSDIDLPSRPDFLPLELDRLPQPARVVEHGDIDLPSRPDSLPLELDRSPQPARVVEHGEVDLPPGPKNALPLKTYKGKAPLGRIPGVKVQRPTFGEVSGETSGTSQRKGINYKMLNAGEISQDLRVEYDPVAGRPNKVSYRVDAGTKNLSRETNRSFRGDITTEGAQSHDSAYLNSGMRKGHLGQREAFKVPDIGDLAPDLPNRVKVENDQFNHPELSADQFTNVVPMTRELNEGINGASAWRQSEENTMKNANRFGHVIVEVTPIYNSNPLRLSDGTPIPRAITRTVKAPDGTILESVTYLNK